jgi:hypothetical protein
MEDVSTIPRIVITCKKSQEGFIIIRYSFSAAENIKKETFGDSENKVYAINTTKYSLFKMLFSAIHFHFEFDHHVFSQFK